MTRTGRSPCKGTVRHSIELANGVSVDVEIDYTITRVIPATLLEPAEGGETEFTIARLIRADLPDQSIEPTFYELKLYQDQRDKLLAMAQQEANYGEIIAKCHEDADTRGL